MFEPKRIMGQSLFMPYQFRLDCHVGIATTFVLAASGDERRRLANRGYTPPCPTNRGHTQAYSVVV